MQIIINLINCDTLLKYQKRVFKDSLHGKVNMPNEKQQLEFFRNSLYKQIYLILKNDNIKPELKAKAITDSIIDQLSDFFLANAKGDNT